ncbi:tetratricopeptide repeat protein [Paraburkholderia sp. RL18-085-BIA-A]|uniref:tetratricopeptide repeat protein n=1 Tax=Paraburkholderia sp. RL18-085-BIA-A TaxID=3031633 RepID=UPI0038B73C0A
MTDTDPNTPSVEQMHAAADVYAAGRYAQAFVLAQKLTEKFPEHSFGWKLMGTSCAQIGQHEMAVDLLRKSIAIWPYDAEAYCNLAVFLDKIGQLEASIESGICALEIEPDYAGAHNQVGSVSYRMGRLDEALSSLSNSIRIDPGYQLARFNLGLTLLTLGRYAEAWPLHEDRNADSVYGARGSIPDLPFPFWSGEPLQGKSLLLWPEQGFGDYVQFIRYARLLKGRGLSRLTIRCPAPLKDLLATATGVDEVMTDSEPVPPHDYWSFPLSLPLHFGTTVDSIPASLPYLRALPDRLDWWRERLPKGFKVGLVWKGSTVHANDAQRSLTALDALRPLWSIPGISFVSLQKGAGEDEARDTELPIVDLGSDIRDFADTAAIVDQLDLVICVDTAVAHVAGALGKPCWVLLPAIGCDWRWMQDRTDSPWYPGALRLFRQKRRGDWSSVIDEVANALREFVR